MQKYSKQSRGFTLVELLVAVALMVILVGAVVMVFTQSSQVISVSEAQMEVYQNARAAMEIIARDLASVQVNTDCHFVINSDPTSNPIMSFTTISSWEDTAGNRESGTVRVEYRLVQVTNNAFNMMRRLVEPPDSSSTQIVDSLLAQYIYRDAATTLHFTVENFTYSGSNFTVNSGDVDVSDTANLPPAVRITVDICDRHLRTVRTFSRTMWIATGGS